MLEIYEKKKEDKQYFLKLEDDTQDVLLVVCDERGDKYGGGNLLRIAKQSGKVHFNVGISDKFGFCLDVNGCLCSVE